MALVPFPGPASDNSEPPEPEETGAKMSFLEHLDELRKRLIYISYSLVVGCAVAYIFIQRIFDFVMKPMVEMLKSSGGTAANGYLIYRSGPEPFMLYLKIGFLAGIFLSSPLIIWQVWKFISPGLYTHEKKFAIPFVVMSTFFFVTGALFSHFIAFKWTWKFFISFSTGYMQFLPDIDDAFGLYTKMLLAFGVIFEMPTLVFFLARMGVITAAFLLRYFKYAVLVIFIVAAIMSPGTDMMSQFIMAVPMLALYIISIAIAAIFGKKKRRQGDILMS
jgi:sec-independent protein translocase protein TatC